MRSLFSCRAWLATCSASASLSFASELWADKPAADSFSTSTCLWSISTSRRNMSRSATSNHDGLTSHHRLLVISSMMGIIFFNDLNWFTFWNLFLRDGSYKMYAVEDSTLLQIKWQCTILANSSEFSKSPFVSAGASACIRIGGVPGLISESASAGAGSFSSSESFTNLEQYH